MNAITSEILTHAFCSPTEARAVLRMGRSAMYKALKTKAIPSATIGGVIKVPVAFLRAAAGIEPAA
jgi:hypothetical protein